MNVIANDFAREFFLTKLRGILDGSQGVPSLQLEHVLEPNVMHTYEGELCPAKHFYRRTIKPTPTLSDRAILTFMRGRLFERILADELPSVTLDGISGRVDGIWSGDLIETKSTTMDMGLFSPLTSQPHWIQRSKAYCKIHGVDKIVLVVWFLIGDWHTKKTQNTGLKCWDLVFDQEELDQNWQYLLRQRDLLFSCLASGRVPDSGWISARSKKYEHPDCEFWDICEYPSKGPKKE